MLALGDVAAEGDSGLLASGPEDCSFSPPLVEELDS